MLYLSLISGSPNEMRFVEMLDFDRYSIAIFFASSEVLTM